MAPRGGGGAGGGGAGGGGWSSLDNSRWDMKFTFDSGSHFHDPNTRADIMNYGICFVATIGIAIWAIVVRKNSRPLRWGILAFSIFLSTM